MRITNVTISPVLLCLLSSLVVGQEAPPPRDLQPITVSAERDITVLFDSDFSFDWEDINAIIQSRQFAGAVIEELTGRSSELVPANSNAAFGGTPGWKASPNSWYVAYVMGRRDLIGGDGSLPLRLYVETTQQADDDKAETEKQPDLKARAEKYATLIIKHLGKVLADLSNRSLEQRLAQLKVTAGVADGAADSAARKVEELSGRLRKRASALSESALQELVGDLTKQRQSLEVELAGMEGRVEALKREIAKSSERLKESSAEDEVLRNLQQVLELRTAAFQLAKQASKVGARGIGPIEVTKAEEQVALAKVELAQAKQAAARPSDERLDKLNDELSQITIGIAENKAKMSFVEERLDRYEEVLEDAAETKVLREQLDHEIRQLISLRQKADAAQSHVRSMESSFRPARVEVFELKASEAKPNDARNAESKPGKAGMR